MRDISDHILDLIENSLSAGAGVVEVGVVVDAPHDRLSVTVNDDGRGLDVPPEAAADPFYTTKRGKVTGLGLSLFKAAAERAGGAFAIGPSALGGTVVSATMKLSHVDRSPLGDLAGAISSIVCTSPDVDIRCRIGTAGDVREILTSDFADGGIPGGLRGLAVARRVSEGIRGALGVLAIEA